MARGRTVSSGAPQGSGLDAGSIVARYTWGVAAVTLAMTVVIALLGEPSAMASAVVMVVAVGLIGLPHGSYDMEVARRIFRPRLGRSWWAVFGGAYLIIAGLALGLWIVIPALGLGLLLVGGAAHWGLDDLECAPRGTVTAGWLALSRGAVSVAAPLALQPAAVAEVFASLLGVAGVDPSLVRSLGVGWLIAAAPGVAWSLLLSWRSSRGDAARAAVEIAVLMLWFRVAPPILAFTVYFCLWHSVRHSIRSAIGAQPGDAPMNAAKRYIIASAAPTVLTWLLGGGLAAFWMMRDGLGLGATSGLELSWGVVFVGLFALTVPHVLLEIIEHRVGAPKPDPALSVR